MIVHPLRALSRADVATAGGKAANLGELLRLGVTVPPGFVVSTAAYAAQARAWGLAQRLGPHLAAGDWDAAAAAASEACLHGALLPAVEGAVRDALRELAAPAVAVRSSATAEDLADASFAGQHESYLDVVGEDATLQALRACWASLWSPRALAYRAARGVDHLAVDIAVIVQRMVPAEFAGVLFTVDPVAQRADRMLLEVAPGIGEAIVSGRTTGDVYRLRRPPFAGATGEAPTSADVVIEDRDCRDGDRPAPDEALLLALARLALRLEADLGGPQDIEFALADGAIHLLQARPITTLSAAEIEPLPQPRLTRMQRRLLAANDADRFPIAPRPLDQWGFRMVLPALYRTLRFVGMDIAEADQQAALAEVWRERLIFPHARPTLRLLGLPRRVVASLRTDWMAWWEREACPRIVEVCAATDLAALDDAALLERAERILTTTREVFGKRFEAIVAMMATPVLQLAVTAAVGRKRAAVVTSDLLSGVHTRTSEVNAALVELARRAAAAGPEVRDPIRAGQPAELRASPAGRVFLAEVDVFLAQHGHRESTGLYLSVPTWQRDPAPMWGLLRGMLDAGEPRTDAGERRHDAALAEVTHKLRRVPGLSAALARLVARLRAVVAFRERSHYDLSRSFTALQAIVAEVARRLHDRGHLPAPDDIFYLTEAEVRTWLSGQVPARPEIERLIRRRRATYGVVNGRWQQWAFAASDPGGEADVLRGSGASSGVVRGRARVIRDEREFGRLEAGEILVCRYTNPAWTPLFTLAAGVVTDAGGPGSHAAIVAREYGVPAVLGAAGATERIRDGQELLVDGSQGRVTLLRRAADR